jgi:dTDP-4-amino-4,6-dideoxygalactose transaminase
MLALRAIADRRGILLIEDAAQALLCTQGGRALGSFGHMAAFSFHDSKVFTTGEGGACVINDPTLRDRAYVVREKGTNRRVFLEGKVDKYGWVSQGTSAFMGGTAAALLDSQLDEWESILARRAAIHQYYDEVFGASAEALGIGRLRLRDGDRLNHHIYWLLFPVIEQRRVVQEALKSEGIEALAHYPALHLSPMARDMGWTPEVALPVAEAIPSCLLRLPLFTEMTDDQAERVAESVARALRSLPGA